jgi:uncharacterized membrane protein
MNDYLLVKLLHILSATFLFGTGIGSAWYLLLTSLGRDVRAVAAVARQVVIADWLFTATTAVIQPLTGWYMVQKLGLPWLTPWIKWSMILYGFAIVCWLPVVGIQMRMRTLAVEAATQGAELPRAYMRCLLWWVGLGTLAFFAFIAIFYLMVFKPS